MVAFFSLRRRNEKFDLSKAFDSYLYQPMETVLRKTRESTGVNCRNVRRRVRCQ